MRLCTRSLGPEVPGREARASLLGQRRAWRLPEALRLSVPGRLSRAGAGVGEAGAGGRACQP